MMDTRTLELINLELDGRLDAATRGELEQRLAADPAARARRAELQAVARNLADAPEPELPAGFREEILARLPQQAAPRRVRRLPASRTWLALAASVVAAVVIVSVVEHGASTGTPVDELSGTLAPAQATLAVTPTKGGLRLAFNLPRSPGDLVVELGGAGVVQSVGTDAYVSFRQEGRRIVIPNALPGRMTIFVMGDVTAQDVTASVIRDGNATRVTPR